MAQSHGFDNNVVIGRETTYGTAPSTFNWAGIVESFDPSESNSVDQRRSVGLRGPFMLRTGAKEVDGSLSVALQNARLIAYALGTVDSDESGGVHTHVITPTVSGEELPSLTVQNHNALHNLTRNYVGGKVDSLTITASAEEAVMMSVDLMFAGLRDSGITPATVVAELDNYFMFYEGAVKINNSDVANVTNFELEVSNNLERRFTVEHGEGFAQRIEEGHLEVTSSLTLDFTDTAQYDLFRQGNEVVVELILQDIADEDRSIHFELTGGLYDTQGLSVEAESLQEQELDVIFTGITVTVKDSNTTLI